MDGTEGRPKGTARNPTEARKAVRAALKDAEHHSRPVTQDYTVSQMIDDYMEVKALNWAFRTRLNNKDLFERHIRPRLGHFKASRVDATGLTRYYQQLTDAHLGSSGQHQISAILSGAYKLAIAQGYLRDSPTFHAKPRRGETSRAEQTYTREQALAFSLTAQQDPMAWVLVFLLFSGLRIGEALALRWEDVTFHEDGEATVHIHKTRSEHRGVAYENAAKTRSSRRRVRVELAGAAILRQRQERGRIEADIAGESPSDYVFCTVRPAGRGDRRVQPMRQDTIRAVMRRICAAAGVPVRSPHALRHTYSSLLADQGVKLAEVSKALGHAKISTTADIYTHAFNRQDKAHTLNLPTS
ncbi:tyrosine-type recombinase/integrase [Deinococcus saxicola]